MAIIKPINPHIHKICELAYIRAAMKECFIGGDKEILDNDEYAVPAANMFMKILEGKNLKC